MDFQFSRDDINILKELVQFRKDQLETPRRSNPYSIDHEETFAPETYLARTPTGGIAALNEMTTGTGTTDDLDDVISSAMCDVYRVLQSGPSSYALQKLTFQRRVFNPIPVALPSRQLVLITRDKFGTWFVTAPFLDFGTCE